MVDFVSGSPNAENDHHRDQNDERKLTVMSEQSEVVATRRTAAEQPVTGQLASGFPACMSV